jgi:hypothetical protein
MTEFNLLQKQNEDYRQRAIESLINGAAKDYAEYRELVGIIRGLSHANLNIQDLLRKLKENDED